MKETKQLILDDSEVDEYHLLVDKFEKELNKQVERKVNDRISDYTSKRNFVYVMTVIYCLLAFTLFLIYGSV